MSLCWASSSLSSLFFDNPVFSCFFLFLEKPGQPAVSVTVQERTALVRVSYSPGADEAPTSITLQYQNSTFTSGLVNLQSGSSLVTRLTHLKPFADCNVTVKASSFFGVGLSTEPFKTSTARK